MTSFMALDCVTSFLRLKDVTNTCKRMRRGLSVGGNSSMQRRNLEEAGDFKFVFVVYCAINRNRSTPVRDLLLSRQLR